MKNVYSAIIFLLSLFAFSANAQTTTGCNPAFTYQFINSSTIKFNPAILTDSPFVQHYWRFGDGSSPSNLISPTHSYTPGTYIVKHILIRNNPNGIPQCADSSVQSITISQASCNLTANFNYDSIAPMQYQFTNTSTGMAPGDSIRWTFGDGTASFASNPNHTYTTPGYYTVCLRVKKPDVAGTVPCVSELCKYIFVGAAQCNLMANFQWYRDSGLTNYATYHFINNSTGINPNDSVRWTFGDGTSSGNYNATHTYAQQGTYNVCLRIQKRNAQGGLTNCVSEICHTVVVQLVCNLQANYTKRPDSLNYRKIYFTNTSYAPASSASATWYFGDGTTANTWNAVHEYANAGRYYVCLRIQSGLCVKYRCDSITVAPIVTCNNTTAGFTDVRDPLMPNKVKFFANANAPILDQLWTITRTPATAASGTVTIHQNNPTYIFHDSGYYRVCLRATFAGGCVKEYCRVIHIEHGVPGTNACTLQAYPNPASSVVNVVVTLNQPSLINAYVYNSLNVQVAQKQQQGSAGNNTVSVNIANLPAGIYRMRIVYENHVCYTTFMKI